MVHSRRDFLGATAAGVLAFCTGGFATIAEAKTGKRVLPVGCKYPPHIEKYRAVVRRYFPKDILGHTPRRLQQEALAIIWVESNGDPTDGPQDGIWQLSFAHGTSEAQRHDIEISTRIAARIYLLQGRRWRPAWHKSARVLGLK